LLFLFSGFFVSGKQAGKDSIYYLPDVVIE